MADLTTTNSNTIVNVGNSNRIGVQITGTFDAIVSFQASIDNTNYAPLALLSTAVTNSISVTTSTVTGVWMANIGGLRTVKVISATYTSGTAVVTMSVVK